MTADDFRTWMDRMGLNILQASAALGLGRNTVTKYRDEGAPIYIALACAALDRQLAPWAAG